VGVNNAAPSVALDITGAAIVNSGATTSTALTTTGRVGVNNAAPTVPLDVSGAARIAGTLDMSFNKIVNLANPTNDQDAATRSYVDTKTTDMATSSSVSTAITNALGSSGTQENRPTVQRGDTTNSTHYLTFVNSTDLPSDSSNNRALMRCDRDLYYNPSTNTLTATRFNGSLSSGSVSAYDGWFSGALGIGISPEVALYPFHVKNGGNLAWTGGYYFSGASSLLNAANDDRTVAAGIEGGWLALSTGVIMFSDQRIKTDIINVDIQSNLELFRKIRPVKHGYIDKLEYGNVHRYGFIAQEVQQLLPDAVIKGTQIIPSIYKKATVVNNVLLHFDKPIQDIKQFSIGTKLKCYDDKNEIVWVVIKAIIDTQNIEIEEKITNDGLFVYGHSVDDFLQIDNDRIYTVATAALQEVDREQQADKARIAELEAKVSNLEATVAAQQSLINDILERLNTLEKA
jgi:hypothetical protein